MHHDIATTVIYTYAAISYIRVSYIRVAYMHNCIFAGICH